MDSTWEQTASVTPSTSGPGVTHVLCKRRTSSYPSIDDILQPNLVHASSLASSPSYIIRVFCSLVRCWIHVESEFNNLDGGH